jgi:hypothetical protein
MQNKKKDISPRNNKEQKHGYWEVYFDGEFLSKCFFVNDVIYGYGLTFKDERYYYAI